MAGTALPVQLPTTYPGTPPQLCDATPFEIRVDTQGHGLWVRGGAAGCADLVDVTTGAASHTVYQEDRWGQRGPIYGIAPDPLGNLFITDLWYGVLRTQRQSSGMGQPENVFGAPAWSADSFGNATGVAVLSDPAGIGPDQLVIADSFRLLIWNTENAATLRTGQIADDVYGAADLNDGSNFNRQRFNYPQVSNGRLWMENTRGWSWAELEGFQYPVCGAKWQASGVGCTQLSTPSRSIPLTPTDTFTGYPLLGSPATKVVANPPDAGDVDFAFTPAGDAVWIADRSNSRVFRIANLNSPDAAYVDVILGQANATDNACNRGGGPQANTFCLPYSVNLDAAGNVFVGDNGGETGTNQRVLEFDASALVTHGTALFGVPATRVYGTGGDFTVGWNASILSPFKPIFDARGPMVVLNNAYTAQRFPVLYLDPLQETLPQLLLGDMTSYPQFSGAVDRHGNLYVPDLDWSRVLIYKTPFSNIFGCGNGVLDSGEECDDGNQVDGDGCDTNCTLTRCGNGVVTVGEQCDDGNSNDNDACKNDCTFTVPPTPVPTNTSTRTPSMTPTLMPTATPVPTVPIPGGGRVASNCTLEFVTAPPPAPGRNGLPGNRVDCTDGDPTCDFDAVSGTCTFGVALCLNLQDSRFTCTPTDVQSVRVRQPGPGISGTIATANRTAVETALVQLGGEVHGVCTRPAFHRGQFCTAPGDCDSAPGAQDGVCSSVVKFSPPLSAVNTCTSDAPITVPLRRTAWGNRAGNKRLRMSAAPSVNARTTTDTDSLTLVCHP